MKLFFLGTGTSSGVPQVGCGCPVCRSTDPRDRRSRCSALIATDDRRLILIDCGPDFRQQMLDLIRQHPHNEPSPLLYLRKSVAEMTDEQARRAGLHEAPRHDYALPLIEAVLLTHEHFDHVGGLDDLRPFSIARPIDIYAEPNVAAPIVRNMHYSFANDRYPGAPHLTMREIDLETPFHVGETLICPIRVMHGKLPIAGYRIGALAYLTDMSSLPDGEGEKLEGIDTLVVNALRHEPHPTHQSIQEAVAFARTVGARQTFFTHLSHGAGLHAETQALLPDDIHLACDGLEIDIDG